MLLDADTADKPAGTDSEAKGDESKEVKAGEEEEKAEEKA